jgi:outer membrane protein assembly factor BamB
MSGPSSALVPVVRRTATVIALALNVCPASIVSNEYGKGPAGRVAHPDMISLAISDILQTEAMLKKIAIGMALVAAVAAGLYAFAGFRVAVDGSGRRPRFVFRANYSALEADRARQHQQATTQIAVAPESSTLTDAAQIGHADDAHLANAAPQTDSAAAAPTRERGYWPDFRGRNRDGRYDETPIRTDWPREGLPRLWKQPVGLGYASFVIADGRAFTIEQRRSQEVVAAYDVNTGRELWTHRWEGEFRESMGGDGPRATPTYDHGRVYALGALGELRCLNAQTGALVWRRNILTDNDAPNLSWGMSAAPLVVDDKVIVLPGGTAGKSVVAYNKLTGVPVWKAFDDPQAYTSPMLVTLGGLRQILVVSALRVMGVTVEEGRLLWDYPWVTDLAISVAQPLLIGNDRVFLSAGYGHGAAVLELRRAGGELEARTVWENTRMKNKFASSVLHDGYIYGLDEAILTCLDADTGEQKWKGGRYGYGQILLAHDHLIVLTEDGDLVLVKATPARHEELAQFSAIEGKTWNHPAIAAGRLLVRNIQEMAAFDILPK